MAVEKCVYENRFMDAWMDEWIRARASTHLLSEEVVAALGAGAAAGALSGKLYVFGGRGDFGRTSSVECFVSGNNTWEALPQIQMPDALAAMAVAVVIA